MKLWGEWVRQAACADPERSVVDERFFSEEASDGGLSDEILGAKALCLGCPVRRPCLEYAFELEDSKFRQGVFGGSTGEQRQAFAAFPDRVDRLLTSMEAEAEALGIFPVKRRVVYEAAYRGERQRVDARA